MKSTAGISPPHLFMVFNVRLHFNNRPTGLSSEIKKKLPNLSQNGEKIEHIQHTPLCEQLLDYLLAAISDKINRKI